MGEGGVLRVEVNLVMRFEKVQLEIGGLIDVLAFSWVVGVRFQADEVGGLAIRKVGDVVVIGTGGEESDFGCSYRTGQMRREESSKR